MANISSVTASVDGETVYTSLGGTKNTPGGGKSHVVTVKAPGALRVELIQYNQPSLPLSLTAYEHGPGEWQFRTISPQPLPEGGGRLAEPSLGMGVTSFECSHDRSCA